MTKLSHPRPSASKVFGAQLSLAAAPPRTGLAVAFALVLSQTVFLAAAGIVFGLRISVDGAATTIELGAAIAELAPGEGVPVDEGVAALLFAAAASAVWGFFFPFRVWRGEVPSRRGYHWAMPVERRLHDLLRTAAGAVWLEAIVVAVLATAAGTAFVSGHAGELAGLSAWVWGSALLAPLLLYLAVSIALVRCEHPAGWVWGTLGCLFLLWTTATRLEAIQQLLWHAALGPVGLVSALAGPVLGETCAELPTGTTWLLAWLLWTAVATAGLWAAAKRPGG